MKKLFDVLVVVVSLALVLGWALTSAASAEEGTCYLQADRDVYLKVYDFDDDGNRLGILWRGRLNEGKSIMLKAPHGSFSYEYNDQLDDDQPIDDQPFASAEQRMCDGNKMISVP